MIIELWVLLASVGLYLILIFTQQVHTDVVMGAKYALSNRNEPKTATASGGRIDRALNNIRENILLYAPIALIIAIVGESSSLTQLGAITFGIGRVVHAVSYLLGILYIRSLAWMAGIVGVCMMAYGLIFGG